MCQQNNNIKSKKGKHLDYGERQSIERWWNRDKRTKVEIAGLLDRNEKTIKKDKKSPEVIAKEIKEMNFKTKMCAKTIRNNIASGDIYDIKTTDMIYNKKHKEKNKEKKVCESVPAEKKHRLQTRRSKYQGNLWTLGR